MRLNGRKRWDTHRWGVSLSTLNGNVEGSGKTVNRWMNPALRFISCLAQYRFTQLCYTHIRNGEKQHVKSWMVLLPFQKITLLL